jgi:hypothetical protein
MDAPPGSAVGKWDAWYKDLTPEMIGSFRYGETVTYRMAASFMAEVGEVEDWGCGAGGFKRFRHGKYVGIDGSKTPFADKIVDLCNYRSRAEGIVIRHVLEHNYRWKEILDGALASFTRKLCLILFTPFSETTREIAHNRQHGVDVPDLSFSRADIEGRFGDVQWDLVEGIPTDTGYKMEHVYFIWRPQKGRKGRAALSPLGLLERAGRAVVDGLELTRRNFASTVRNAPPKRAIYTAIFGNYDRLSDFPKTGENADVDRICFSDDPALAHPQWEVRVVSPPFHHPRLAAKYYKALPHRVLPEYDETVWVDASFRVRSESFVREVFGYLGQAHIALFLHPERGCIYDEAEFCKKMPKYVDQRVLEQVAHYRAQGFPAGAGLFAGGVIARTTHDPEIRRLNELWLEENVRWTYQDQLSLPYLLWSLGIEPAVFRQYLWKTGWGTWDAHAHDR